MPKRHNRRMKGGFLDELKSLGSSLWDKTKDATSSLFGSNETSQPSYSSTQPTQPTQPSYSNETEEPSYGGRRSRKNCRKRNMRGGFKGFTPTTSLAAHSASFSGQTAKPHTMVGGKTRKRHGGRKHRHSKSCKHNKH